MMQFLQMILIATIYTVIIFCYRWKRLEFPKAIVQFIFSTLAISGSIFVLLKVFYNYIYLAPSGFYLLFSTNQLIISGLIAVLVAIITIIMKVTISFEKKNHSKKFYIITLIISTIILLPSYVLIWGSNWLVKNFGLVSPDEIIFHLKVPLEGTNTDVVVTYIKESLLLCIVLLVVSLIIIVATSKFKVFVTFKIFSKKISSMITIKRVLVVGLPLLLIMTVRYAYMNLDFNEYIKLIRTNSTFIEENLADPQEINLSFPEKKKNLIYIFMESMESTYMSIEYGGAKPENYLPELTELARNNISFSNSDHLGGALQAPGTGWTIAGMVSQTSGIPLKIPIEGNSYGDESDTFLPGAYSIGEILEKEGYNQSLMVGSNASFGGRAKYFSQHGNYKILDYDTAIEDNIIAEDYYVFWGFEDQILYGYAKQEIERLSKEDAPFNFTMLTVDTHHPAGYICEICGTDHSDQYSNVISCASKQVAEFVSWIQKQDFYEDTTIVISGDHLSMNSDYFYDMPENFKRTTFNTFINSSVATDHLKNRDFGTYDMFPTTLASLGVEIEGDRLGLGTNLFSDRSTLMEEYGVDNVMTELNGNSKYYNTKFVYSK